MSAQDEDGGAPPARLPERAPARPTTAPPPNAEAAAMTPEPAKENQKRKPRRVVRALIAMVLGTVVGLVIAEVAFYMRDDGAFPHVNFYVPDDELGVRLEPGATMRLKFRDNPTTDIRVNAAGFRGADWPAPREGEILVVGDSQVFGLGVEEDETMASVLGELTGRPVLNAGVPTYGPLEYNAMVREAFAERSPTTVVYVVNMGNDLFETERPNRARHAVWDGWAVRVETAPETITVFPGRDWLYRSSHLVYALRGYYQEHGTSMEVEALPSEGTWHDLVGAGETSRGAHEEAEHALAVAAVEQRHELSRIEMQLDDVEGRIDRIVLEHNEDDVLAFDEPDNRLRIEAARANPADIVLAENVEEGRAIHLTATVIRHAVRFRDRLIARTAAAGDGAEAMSASVAERRAVQRQRDEALRRAVSPTPVPSVLAPRIEEVAALCEQNGAELVVVGLPLDVMVSSDEWAKYGVEPIDMEPTLALIDDLVGTARRMGIRGVDATEGLRAALPGAFLDGDLHLTAKGQRALAEVVAAALAEPAPFRVPDNGVPDGRTRIPAPMDWIHTPEAIVRGSTAAHCETVRIGEWLRVRCDQDGRRGPRSTGVEVVEGGRGEALTLTTSMATSLVAPIFAGEPFAADFFWEDRRQRLVVDWAADAEAPTMYFEEAVPGDARPFVEDEVAERLCTCHEEIFEEKDCRIEFEWPVWDSCTPTCANVYGAAVPGCLERYGDDCEVLLRCVRGDPIVPPTCPEGFANAGATGHCFALCNDERPCEEGRCVEWQGGQICVQ